ncbi:MAG TPA: HAMP domain-containing sensor histidine kinase [Steroidobacteraceae bacterium]|nr:HAMP domain-containing sensor histidine kinase [Steroidobacteraceae bacterium]
MNRPMKDARRWGLFNTSAFRMSMGYTLLVTLAVCVTLGSTFYLTQRIIQGDVDLIIDTEIKSLQNQYVRSGVPGLTEEINLRIDSWGRIGAVYMLAGPKFDRLAGNVTNWPFDGAPAEPYPEFRIESIEPGQRSVHPVRAAVRKLPNGDWLLVGTDMSQDRRYVRTFQIATLWGIGLSILAAAIAGFSFTFRLARRVGDVTDTCVRIMSGEQGHRLPVIGKSDEFDALATSVNRVLDRLEEQTRTLRATFDSVAHDLRAPLHRLRTRMDAVLRLPALESGIREPVESALREVDRLQRTLATLLQIALAESGAPLASPGPVDIGELADELTELFEPVARESGLTLTGHADRGVVVEGNRQLLAQLITNLLENALKYVPAGGRIEVTVKRLPGRAHLIITDNGPGMPAEERQRAGQPFVRIGQRSGLEGSGLGLSLVSAIARLHRARLTLESNDPGLRAVVSLPLSDAQVSSESLSRSISA